jgi:hypothetical protein
VVNAANGDPAKKFVVDRSVVSHEPFMVTYFQGTEASLLLLPVHSRVAEVRMGSCDACHLLLLV